VVEFRHGQVATSCWGPGRGRQQDFRDSLGGGSPRVWIRYSRSRERRMKSSRATGTGRALDRRKHPEMHGMAARQGEFQDSLSHVRTLLSTAFYYRIYLHT
jgi:hypothetical protein